MAVAEYVESSRVCCLGYLTVRDGMQNDTRPRVGCRIPGLLKRCHPNDTTWRPLLALASNKCGGRDAGNANKK